ncbi:MAG TPA: membrane protein insertase YidC [Bauldia sp.]|nr:membrane protein insertase YidC [Bauldia sp.]
MPDNRNLFLAIALSIAVLLGWQFFVAGPQMEQARKQAELQAQQQQQQTVTDTTTPAQTGGETTTTTTAAAGGAPVGAATTPALTRDAALALSPRVSIATDTLAGSINLTGGRIDDLRLLDFHETVDKSSPTIVLLSPARTPVLPADPTHSIEAKGPYYAEFGWIGAAGGPPVPGPETQWKAADGAKLTPATPVTLTYDNGAGLVFTRTIAIDDKYMFTVTDNVANSTGQPVTLTPYGRVTRFGDPQNGSYILHLGLIGVVEGQSMRQEDYHSLQKDMVVDLEKAKSGWLGINDKYWATAMIPEPGKEFTGKFERIETPAGYQADYVGTTVSVGAGGTTEASSRLFAGAKQVAVVNSYRDAVVGGIPRFDLLIDWGEWLWIITKPMFAVMDFFFHLFGNFGLAILAVTVVVKALFFPLANKSYKSMSAMKKVQPQMAAIREQYADDKVKQQQAMMELYKKEKINPLAGCWPIAIQIPVFFSLYKVLYVTIEMRHAPFFGWIQDLSAPDPTSLFNLFGLIPYDPGSVPFIGHFLMLGLWPLIMGVTMFVQMRLNPPPPDPTQAMIFTWLPLIFTFMLASFPAGLVIYWAWNNTLSVSQQYFIMRRQGADVDLWGNILQSLGLRAAKPQTAAAVPAPANDMRAPAQKNKKPKAEKAKG